MRVMPAPITARALAVETEVSLRTLYRDIESLRAAGAQIDGERGYGYHLIEDYALPPQTLDRDEIEALVLGLAEVKHMGDTTLASAASSLLAKVAATLPDEHERQLFHAVSKVYRPNTRMTVSVDMDVIRNACWKEQALLITYEDKKNNTTERLIFPLCMMYTEHTLTLLSWCCLRADFRMFRGDSIKSVKDSSKSFRPQRATMLRSYLTKLNEMDQDT